MTSHIGLIAAAIASAYMGLASAWQYVETVKTHQEQVTE
jgi:hypothetical protein